MVQAPSCSRPAPIRTPRCTPALRPRSTPASTSPASTRDVLDRRCAIPRRRPAPVRPAPYRPCSHLRRSPMRIAAKAVVETVGESRPDLPKERARGRRTCHMHGRRTGTHPPRSTCPAPGKAVLTPPALPGARRHSPARTPDTANHSLPYAAARVSPRHAGASPSRSPTASSTPPASSGNRARAPERSGSRAWERSEI